MVLYNICWKVAGEEAVRTCAQCHLLSHAHAVPSNLVPSSSLQEASRAIDAVL